MLLNSLDQWSAYLGHFHPLVVHLPIGFLILALLTEGIFRKRRSTPSPLQAVPFMLAVGCLGAVLSCLLGWLLSKTGNYDENTLLWHQYSGMALALISGVCWWIKNKTDAFPKAKRAYSVLLIILFITLIITGHNGGSMTHGNDYLTAGWFADNDDNSDTTHVKRKPVTNINEAYVYADLVHNILADKCYSCHGPKKVKGGLRVDDEKLLFKGGKHGVVIKPGDPGKSELMIRILLPEGDDKRMPPKKKQSLTPEEIALLKWWIQNGADTHKKVKDFPAEAAMVPVLAAFTGSTGKDSGSISPLSGIFEKELPPANQRVIDTLTSLGILVSPVAKNKNLLEISCVNYPGFNDNTMSLLTGIADHIVILKLDGTAITDAAFNNISKFRNLVRLNIAHTAVTGAAMEKLSSLPGLEYINIVGTKVDDGGLKQLQSLPSLKRVYCWNSLVTKNGLSALNKDMIIAVAEE